MNPRVGKQTTIIHHHKSIVCARVNVWCAYIIRDNNRPVYAITTHDRKIRWHKTFPNTLIQRVSLLKNIYIWNKWTIANMTRVGTPELYLSCYVSSIRQLDLEFKIQIWILTSIVMYRKRTG